MRHDLAAFTISPDADALDAISKMQRNGVSCLLVTEGDRLVGMIGQSDLLRFLHLKLDLEGTDDNIKQSGEARRGDCAGVGRPKAARIRASSFVDAALLYERICSPLCLCAGD